MKYKNNILIIKIIMQYLKTGLLDFIKSTKNTKVLYSTHDLNNQNKKAPHHNLNVVLFIFN